MVVAPCDILAHGDAYSSLTRGHRLEGLPSHVGVLGGSLHLHGLVHAGWLLNVGGQAEGGARGGC